MIILSEGETARIEGIEEGFMYIYDLKTSCDYGMKLIGTEEAVFTVYFGAVSRLHNICIMPTRLLSSIGGTLVWMCGSAHIKLFDDINENGRRRATCRRKVEQNGVIFLNHIFLTLLYTQFST